MIFTRVAVIVVTSVLLVAVLGPGSPAPGPAIAGRELVRERALVADAALHALEEAIDPALDEARQGAARAVAGDEAPGPPLTEASDALREAVAAASAAASAVTDLDAARHALDPDAAPLPALPAPAEIGSIADQLAGTAPVADAFVAMRLRAEALTERLAMALREMESGDRGAAATTLATARADHDALEAWDLGLLTLPVWLETTDEMLSAAEDLLAALEMDDVEAAETAAERVAALDEEARSADRALRIAMAEGGASVTAAPLGRLAAALGQVAETRTAMASILQSVGR